MLQQLESCYCPDQHFESYNDFGKHVGSFLQNKAYVYHIDVTIAFSSKETRTIHCSVKNQTSIQSKTRSIKN